MSATTAPGASLRRVLLVGLLAAAVSLLGVTQARPAAALLPIPAPVTLPAAAGGVAAVNGALVAGAFAVGYYGSQAVLRWAFGDKFGADAPPTTPAAGIGGIGYGYAIPTGGQCSGTTPPACPYRLEAYVKNPGSNDAANFWFNNGNSTVSLRYVGVDAATGYGKWRQCTVAECGSTDGADRMFTDTSSVWSQGTHVRQCCTPDAYYYSNPQSPILRGPGAQSYTSKVRLTCRNAVGTTAVYETAPATYQAIPGATSQDVNVPSCSSILPDSQASRVEVVGGKAGGTQTTVIDKPTFTSTAETNYPACTVQAGAAQPCQLLPKIGAVSCFTGSVECGGWATRANHQCTWGPYTVPDTWCTSAYADYLAQTSTLPPFDPGADPVSPVPGTSTTPGSTVTNPDGSKTSTQTQTLPDGSTRTITQTTFPNGRTITRTCTGAGVCSTVETPPTGEGTQADPDGRSCMAGGFSWNPVSWVYTPVKCAMVWAFVPSPATMTALSAAASDVGSRVPLSYLLEAGGFVVGVLGGANGGTASGCFVYDVNLGELGTFHIIDSCADEAVPNAIRPWRPLLGVAVYVSFLGPLAWWAWKSYAPLSRPQG